MSTSRSPSRSLEDSFGAIRHWEGLPEVPQYYGVAEHAALAAAYGGSVHKAMSAEMLYGQFDSKGICGDAPIGKYEGYLHFDRPLLSKEVKDYWSKALYDMVSKESFENRWLRAGIIVKPKKNRLLLLL